MSNTTGTPTSPSTPGSSTSTSAERTADAQARSVANETSRQGAATEAKLSSEASATAGKARDEASKTYETAADEAARLKDKALGLGEQAKSAAVSAADEARSYARNYAESQKSTAAEGVRDVSRALGDAADQLDDRYGFVAGYIRDAAGEVDRVASSLKDRSVDDLFYSVESFARRQPTAFLGATVLAGFALARFIKSSARDDYETAGYGGAPHYGMPADRPYGGGSYGVGAQGGAAGDPYAEAGIPGRAVNPPNRTPTGARPNELASNVAGGTSGAAATVPGTPGAAKPSSYTSGTSASSPVTGSGTTKSA